MDFTKFIQKYEEQFTTNMTTHANLFCTIGSGNESPRWYNFKEVDENNILTIGSTQNNNLFFTIQLEGDEWMHVQNDVQNFWQAFKEYRTDFLKINYPTIKL